MPSKWRNTNVGAFLADALPWSHKPGVRKERPYPIKPMRQSPRFLLLFSTLALARCLHAADEPPTDWIDPDTGHRVIRLSREPGTASLYFNQNAYTADGKKIIVTTPGGGIAAIDLQTREVKPLVPGPVSVL